VNEGKYNKITAWSRRRETAYASERSDIQEEGKNYSKQREILLADWKRGEPSIRRRD